MIDSKQLLTWVIRPVLKDLDLWSVPAERLVLGTAAVESECGRWLAQIGGPALGAWQMEPASHDDIHDNFLKFRPELQKKVLRWNINAAMDEAAEEMAGNLYYACAMARIQYLRDPAPIPDDLLGQSKYYKRVYNTEQGKGSADGYRMAWDKFAASIFNIVA